MNKTFFVFIFPKLQITTTALLRLLKMSTVHACASELKRTCSEMLDGKARAELKLWPRWLSRGLFALWKLPAVTKPRGYGRGKERQSERLLEYFI